MKSEASSRGKGAVAKHVAKNGAIRSALSSGKMMAEVVNVGPVDIVLGGLGLTEVFIDQFKAGKKNAKLAG